LTNRLVQIQPYRGEIVVPGQGKARSTRRNAEFGFSFHSILFRSCSCAFLQAGTLFLCKGRAIAFRKSTSACEIVYRILENWSTGNENFVKEFEKTVDRVLKNCYDGHGQRNDCGVRRLKMEKNMKSKIVVDSSANVYELPDVGFACVPLKILTDEQEYVDTAEVDAPALAEMLRTYKGRTSTSCPNISDWMAAYEGADEVYVVTITGTLSGAYNAALLAGEEYEQSHEGARVFVLDSLSTGAESRLLVERLAALIKAGKPFDTVCEEIRAYHEHTHLLFALESLANLARNGRVKPAVAAVARMLGIRVIGQASDAGDLEVLCKTRGEHGALERMVLEMKAHGLTNGRVHIDHCCNATAAERLKHMVHAVFPEAKVEVGSCGALCSYYAEYGGLMVGYEDNEAPTV
jgi:DegV family protein with EDD domain